MLQLLLVRSIYRDLFSASYQKCTTECVQLFTGSSLITTKKASSHSSSHLTTTCPPSSSKGSPISYASVSVSTPRGPSSLLSKKNTESKMNKLSISRSTSKILEYSEKQRKRIGNTSFSTRSLSALDRSSCTPPARWSNSSSSVSLSSSLRTNQKSKVSTTKYCTLQRNDAKVAPDLQKISGSNLSHSLQSPEMKSPVKFSFRALEEFHHVGLESPKTGNASGLRMPSPKIGYFDEVSFSNILLFLLS